MTEARDAASVEAADAGCAVAAECRSHGEHILQENTCAFSMDLFVIYKDRTRIEVTQRCVYRTQKTDDVVTNLSYIYAFVISKETMKAKQEISELITESEVSSSI